MLVGTLSCPVLGVGEIPPESPSHPGTYRLYTRLYEYKFHSFLKDDAKVPRSVHCGPLHHVGQEEGRHPRAASQHRLPVRWYINTIQPSTGTSWVGIYCLVGLKQLTRHCNLSGTVLKPPKDENSFEIVWYINFARIYR